MLQDRACGNFRPMGRRKHAWAKVCLGVWLLVSTSPLGICAPLQSWAGADCYRHSLGHTRPTVEWRETARSAFNSVASSDVRVSSVLSPLLPLSPLSPLPLSPLSPADAGSVVPLLQFEHVSRLFPASGCCDDAAGDCCLGPMDEWVETLPASSARRGDAVGACLSMGTPSGPVAADSGFGRWNPGPALSRPGLRLYVLRI